MGRLKWINLDQHLNASPHTATRSESQRTSTDSATSTLQIVHPKLQCQLQCQSLSSLNAFVQRIPGICQTIPGALLCKHRITHGQTSDTARRTN